MRAACAGLGPRVMSHVAVIAPTTEMSPATVMKMRIATASIPEVSVQMRGRVW